MAEPAQRPQWGSRIGFIMAAAGSAVGLGNIWKFPYITGENGGGVFVLIYLVCVLLVAMPIMLAEMILGHGSRQSPVGAFEHFHRKGSLWGWVGWLGVASGFVILSYYSVVAGWALNYVLLSLKGFTSMGPDAIGEIFGAVYASPGLNLFWHAVFMALTVGVVLGGVQKGIEKTCNILMPLLLVLLVFLVIRGIFLPEQGFRKALTFLFMPGDVHLNAHMILEALGHSFFTLSLGMGAMLTYGSYLKTRKELLGSALAVSGFDTLIAMLACLMLFPIIFAFGFESQAGPGLVFKTVPIVFSQLTGGMFLALVFFLMLAFAALTSAISLLEVVTSTFMDKLGWTRRKATLVPASLIFLLGMPSAVAGSGRVLPEWMTFFGRNFFDTMDYLASNWMLPVGGLLTALFVGWVIPDARLRQAFGDTEHPAWLYTGFALLIRFVAPVLVLLILLNKVGLITV
ncbi:MAG: sodium-dependent transporter [Calditrichaeota bacterium]|nr:sodium-dependent transporter [Calditrichota bacterium]MCB9473243.1 sodium-dependent transporter [Candidatus Delongbacteria bacterium]